MSNLSSLISNIQIQYTITKGEIATLVILALTLITAIIYACYTAKLWKEANFQSMISISPYTIFDINREDEVYVENIGKSAAFNVTIESLTIIDTNINTKEKAKYILSFEPIYILSKGESKQVKHKSTLPDGSSSSLSFVHTLNPKYQDKYNYLFTINYTNIFGKRYATKFYAGKDGIRIKKIYRVTFRHKLARLVFTALLKIRRVFRF